MKANRSVTVLAVLLLLEVGIRCYLIGPADGITLGRRS
jgi:hypothetical protein